MAPSTGEPGREWFGSSGVIDSLHVGDSQETTYARNARVALDQPLSSEIPTVELLVEQTDGGEKTRAKENEASGE
ncbi:hypothetical protein [Rhodococcus jostii]|uniref:Uncharacterized protein n=1 Tax=Rhodococcus jostii TaxID=132919 RepID=A0A1H4ITZ5_RHOJO|nr:hypothetical protein [Rhodococcus jostii]SEB37560.1 hypothetical protein SAMN04490220_0522 [Rhodococcus jostii]